MAAHKFEGSRFWATFITAILVIIGAIGFALLFNWLIDRFDQADAASAGPVAVVNATTEDTDKTGMNRWVQDPQCPDGSFTATFYVGSMQIDELEMTTAFTTDGFANEFSLYTDVGNITDIYLLRRVPEFGHPDDVLVDWSLLQFVPEQPSPAVSWNTGDLVLTSDDALRVCITRTADA